MGKKQHYIPRMLLKYFNTGNDKLINIFILSQKVQKDNIGLYEQACANYLYGKDQQLEDFFSKIESITAKAFEKIIKLDIHLQIQEKINIAFFISYQLNRTPKAVNQLNSFIDQTFKTIARHDKKIGKLEDHYSIKLKNPYNLMFQNATKAALILFDLNIGLLENKTDIPFIIGEHPVMIFNPYFESKKWINSKNGIATKGCLICMPLTPQLMLVLYDKKRYKFTNFQKIISINRKSVHQLNKCQIAQTLDCVFFNKIIDNEIFYKYCDEVESFRDKKESEVNVYPKKTGKKFNSEIIVSNIKDLPIKHEFDWLKLTYHAELENMTNNPDIAREGIMEVIENIDKILKELLNKK